MVFIIPVGKKIPILALFFVLGAALQALILGNGVRSILKAFSSVYTQYTGLYVLYLERWNSMFYS